MDDKTIATRTMAFLTSPVRRGTYIFVTAAGWAYQWETWLDISLWATRHG